MIEVVFNDLCTQCGACVEACPTNVLQFDASGYPVIARQNDCQTCFMCELYCKSDAIYVAPDCTKPTAVEADAIRASGHLGQFRRDSGWDEWAEKYSNDQWKMDVVFKLAPTLALPSPKGEI